MAWRAGFSPPPSLFALLIPPQITSGKKAHTATWQQRWLLREKKKWLLSIEGNQCHIWPKKAAGLPQCSIVKMSLTCEKLLLSLTSVQLPPLIHFMPHNIMSLQRVSFCITQLRRVAFAECCSNTEALCTLTGCVLYNLYCSTRYYTTRLLLFWHHLIYD